MDNKASTCGVYHSREIPSYTLYKGAPETIQHTVAGCQSNLGQRP